MTDEDARSTLVEIMALIDEAHNKLNGMGFKQQMSVGPVLSDVSALRAEVVERGKAYGILPESARVAELRHDATGLEVSVRPRPDVGEGVHHLRCTECDASPSYAIVEGDGVLVCHCTHVDGAFEPWPVHGFEGRPEAWEYVAEEA